MVFRTQLSLPTMHSPDRQSCIGLPVAAPPSAVRSGHVSLRSIAYSSLTTTFFRACIPFLFPFSKHDLGHSEFQKGQSFIAVFNNDHPNSPATIEGVVVKKGVETVYNLETTEPHAMVFLPTRSNHCPGPRAHPPLAMGKTHSDCASSAFPNRLFDPHIDGQGRHPRSKITW